MTVPPSRWSWPGRQVGGIISLMERTTGGPSMFPLLSSRRCSVSHLPVDATQTRAGTSLPASTIARRTSTLSKTMNPATKKTTSEKIAIR